MARSPLYGVDSAPGQAAGRDSAALGPSDTTDSGSDVANLDYLDDSDPSMPVDRATGWDSEHATTTHESVGPGIDSDASGTGERRSATGDAGLREAADIEADRIIDPNAGLGDESDMDDRVSLEEFADASADEEAEEEGADEGGAAEGPEVEDEEADPVGQPRGRGNTEPDA